MFRFFEGLVDPYLAYEEADTPPRRLWPFLAQFFRPFRAVFAVTGVLAVLVAASDVALIWYVGRLVDLLGQDSPADVWATYGTEIILVALAILVLRPAVAVVEVALLHNTILPNFGTMIGWRSTWRCARQRIIVPKFGRMVLCSSATSITATTGRSTRTASATRMISVP